MILRACRYFNGTYDYWLDALTMDILRAQNEELTEVPPADVLVAAYFEANGMWKRPHSTSPAQDDSGGVWEPDLPEVLD